MKMIYIYTYFEAEIIIDYYDCEKNGEKIYLMQASNYEWQIRNCPIYQTGERFVMFIIKNPNNDNWGSFVGSNSVFDVRVGEDGNEYLYKRLGNVPADYMEMSSAERNVVTSFDENPTNYMQKLTIEDLVSAVESYDKTIDYTSFRDSKVSLYPLSKEEIAQIKNDKLKEETNTENNTQDNESETENNEDEEFEN